MTMWNKTLILEANELFECNTVQNWSSPQISIDFISLNSWTKHVHVIVCFHCPISQLYLLLLLFFSSFNFFNLYIYIWMKLPGGFKRKLSQPENWVCIYIYIYIFFFFYSTKKQGYVQSRFLRIIFSFQDRKHIFTQRSNRQFTFQNTKHNTLKKTQHTLEKISYLLIGIFWVNVCLTFQSVRTNLLFY